MQQNHSLFSKGVELYNVGEYEKALNIFDSFSPWSGNDSDILLHKWNTLGALGRFSEAIDSFDAIIKSDATNLLAKKAKEIFETIAKHSRGKTISSKQILPLPIPMAETDKKTYQKKPAFIKEDKQEITRSYGESQENMDMACGSYPASAWSDGGPYDSLRSQEARIFFKKNELKNLNIPKIIDDPLTNTYDRDTIMDHIKKNDSFGLAGFVKNVILRNTILAYLADSNILPPRKYNTIISQIENINAEFALAFLMFNIGEEKYHEILVQLWEKSHAIEKTSPEKAAEKSEKVGILTLVLSFFLWIFSFEKAFANENNKLRYFKYLFVFLGFLGMLTLVWYGIKNDLFKVDIKATRTTTASWTVESVTSMSRL